MNFVTFLFSRCYSAYSCGARKIFSLGAAEFFDRGAVSCSLHLPQAALALKATKLSHISILNCFIKNEFYYFSFFALLLHLLLRCPKNSQPWSG